MEEEPDESAGPGKRKQAVKDFGTLAGKMQEVKGI